MLYLRVSIVYHKYKIFTVQYDISCLRFAIVLYETDQQKSLINHRFFAGHLLWIVITDKLNNSR